jgi:hypothetical protein
MARRISGSGRADEFLESGIAYGEEGGGKQLAVSGEAVAMSLGDFLDDGVRAEESQLAADLGGEGLGLGGGSVEGEEQAAQVAIAKPTVANSPPGDDLEQSEIGGVADAQSPQAAPAVAHARGDLVEEFAEACGVIDGGESIEIGLVGALRDLSAAVQIGDSLRKGCQASLPERERWRGRKTLKLVVLAMVVSTRRTLPALSYILTELPSAQCLMRTPSWRRRRREVSSPLKLW